MRPSEIYFIQDELASFNFDRAVFMFGMYVESEMHQAAEKAKNGKAARTKSQAVLNRILAEPGEAGAQFRDPARR